MKTDTPRTDERKASFALDTIRQLETELTAVTEQRDELLRYNEAFRNETLICADCDSISKEEYDQAIEQRDRLAEALQLFLNRVQYNSVFMDGKLRGGTFDYRSSGFDDEVTQAYEALAAVKGGADE
jgi:hypothetical protein